MIQVLLIDDDKSVQDLIRIKLNSLYQMDYASSLQEGKHFIQIKNPDIIILDEVLPDGNGLEFLEKLLAKFSIPVIMLTSRKDIESKKIAFDRGAVDYITKPFNPEELKIRINARVNNSTLDLKGDLNFDLKVQKIFINTNNILNDSLEKKYIELTPAEFKILYLLSENKLKVYNRIQIIENVWGKEHSIDQRTIDQHISKIRKKIEMSQVKIKSKHGEGYYCDY